MEVNKEHEEVYYAVRGEREYQQKMIKANFRVDMVEIDMAGILLAMEHILNEARTKWYTDSEEYDYEDTMHRVRKIAGLAFAAGEKYGMPRREGY
jgi:hypothetical protein